MANESLGGFLDTTNARLDKLEHNMFVVKQALWEIIKLAQGGEDATGESVYGQDNETETDEQNQGG
jgi:hypothetical protein